MYGRQGGRDRGLALGEFAATAGGPGGISGGALGAAPGAPLEVTVAVDAVEPRPADVRVTFVRNGSAIAAWSGSTPFRAPHPRVGDGRPALFPPAPPGGGAARLSNPLFPPHPRGAQPPNLHNCPGPGSCPTRGAPAA